MPAYKPRHLLHERATVTVNAARRPVIGRLFWGPDQQHPSPWMSFTSLTAFRTWSREVRRARPGTKTEMAYLDRWTAEAMLAHVQTEAKKQEAAR